MKVDHSNFWESTPLHKLNQQQWESLCDGCAQCCAHKLEDADSGEVFKTNVVCQYLDTKKCQCTVYEKRHQYVADCIKITPDNSGELLWMPETCGYRRVANGLPLPEWHPLVTGDKDSARKAGIGVSSKVISEADIDLDDLESYLVDDDYFSLHVIDLDEYQKKSKKK